MVSMRQTKDHLDPPVRPVPLTSSEVWGWGVGGAQAVVGWEDGWVAVKHGIKST